MPSNSATLADIRARSPSSKSLSISCSSPKDLFLPPLPVARSHTLVYKQWHLKENLMRPVLAVLLFLPPIFPIAAPAQSAASDRPFVVEYYYKTKWGHADEFLKRFNKNHYPVLKKEMELAGVARVGMDHPRYE